VEDKMSDFLVPESTVDRLLDYLVHEFDNYPYDETKDPKYFTRLVNEFLNVDIENELKAYHAWILDQPDGKKIYYRSRFRSWLKRAEEFRRNPVNRTPYWIRRLHAQSCK
jgi:hypothetical protein